MYEGHIYGVPGMIHEILVLRGNHQGLLFEKQPIYTK